RFLFFSTHEQRKKRVYRETRLRLSNPSANSHRRVVMNTYHCSQVRPLFSLSGLCSQPRSCSVSKSHASAATPPSCMAKKESQFENQVAWQMFPVQTCLFCSSMDQKLYPSIFGMVVVGQAPGGCGEIVIAAVGLVKEPSCRRRTRVRTTM
ncbi:hypothetical protein A2U01_0011349, partial [Trifolium medium]|nr:hypothetical protein [Trifolium medium]